MNENNNIDVLRTWCIIILILIVLFLSKCMGDRVTNHSSTPQNTELIDTTKTEPIDTVFITEPAEKIDTAAIIRYCVENRLYKELFPKRRPKVVKDTIYIAYYPSVEEEIKADKDTILISNTVEVSDKLIVNFPSIKIKETAHPFIGFGITTFPSISMEAGVMFPNYWGFAIEGNYYFYNGIIENAVVPNNVNLIVRTKSVTSIDQKIGIVEIPNFSAGLKVIKMF